MGGCTCFASPPRVTRCIVIIRAQMIGPGGTARISGPRDSMAMLAMAPLRINEDGVAAPDAASSFMPPTSFPGLSTALAAALQRASRAADVVVTKVSVAPTAGGLYAVTISATADVTFSPKAAADAAAWGEALQPPAVESVEEQVAVALTDGELPAGLESILVVAISGPGTPRREESSVRRARRPSTVALRVSGGGNSLTAEIAAAPPGMFPPVPPREAPPPPLS
jgi:hypothetical protein